MRTLQINLKKPLACIKKDGLVSFYLEERNGSWVIVSGTFTQTIKKSEFDQIMANQIGASETVENVTEDNNVSEETTGNQSVEDQIKKQEEDTDKEPSRRGRKPKK